MLRGHPDRDSRSVDWSRLLKGLRNAQRKAVRVSWQVSCIDSEVEPLRSRLEDLKAEGRLIKLAETIAFLQDDEAGFTPAAVADLL